MGLWQSIIHQPVTTAHVVLITALWVYLYTRETEVTKIAYQYERVITHHEYWRLITATYSHLALLHLAFNMFSLWSVGSIEGNAEFGVGSLTYLKYTFVLIILSMAVVTLVTYVMSTYFSRVSMRDTYSLGYSCVVFGWMTVSALRGKMSAFGIPPLLFPFASLLFTQILIPNASFVGHLSGIVVGLLLAFRLFDWVSDYLFFCGVFWTLCVFIWSVKTTTTFPLLCLDVPNNVETGVEIAAAPRPRMVNGSVVYNNGVGSDNV